MADPGPAALVLVVRIVHIARLDPSCAVDIAGARVRRAVAIGPGSNMAAT
ncbi:hypothetical protein GCM10017667_18970 [Streptomyces filamentosus]|uniref:Uncharacterized protein n=1 Tax=Streptomyces filamentosus TaxID=67294 RepID=A0A919EKN8_STRFL|nr:hypothetical protein GCM10017667_18970 [Streptomyces filamentosus]